MKLKPCPFCKSENVNTATRIYSTGLSSEMFIDKYVRCDNCGARGPLLRMPCSRKQTEASWNTRGPIALELKLLNDDVFMENPEPVKIRDVKLICRDNINCDQFIVETDNCTRYEIRHFGYVKNADTGAMYVKDGRWVFISH